MGGRTYTDEQKAEALDLWRQHGAAEASRRCGVPSGTITSWANRAGLASVRSEQTRAATEAKRIDAEARRARIRETILERIDQVLDRMHASYQFVAGKDGDRVSLDLPPADAVRNFAVALGVLIDKYRLEMGEATGRTENTERVEVDEAVSRVAAAIGVAPDQVVDELAKMRRRKSA